MLPGRGPPISETRKAGHDRGEKQHEKSTQSQPYGNAECSMGARRGVNVILQGSSMANEQNVQKWSLHM